MKVRIRFLIFSFMLTITFWFVSEAPFINPPSTGILTPSLPGDFVERQQLLNSFLKDGLSLTLSLHKDPKGFDLKDLMEMFGLDHITVLKFKESPPQYRLKQKLEQIVKFAIKAEFPIDILRVNLRKEVKVEPLLKQISERTLIVRVSSEEQSIEFLQKFFASKFLIVSLEFDSEENLKLRKPKRRK